MFSQDNININVASLTQQEMTGAKIRSDLSHGIMGLNALLQVECPCPYKVDRVIGTSLTAFMDVLL